MSIHRLFLGTLLIATLGCGALIRPSDVKVSNAAQAVADARQLMAEKRSDPNKHQGWIYASSLPQSLRLPRLRYCTVYEDHVNLVLARNPDWQIGARIWAADSKRVHNDKKTQYSGIFFFEYCKESASRNLNNIL